MANENPVQYCDTCKVGVVSRVLQRLAFRQWTDRGYVSCSPLIPMDVCNHCGAKTWDDEAEQILEQAVQEEYKKLP